MSRFKSLKANPRRSLAALATVLVAVGVTGASGADFSAQTANAGNTFTAGTLSMSNDKAGAILTASNMKPGDPASKGEVKIKNTGSVAGTFKLTRGTVVDSDTTNRMSTKLNVVVTDCGADLLCSTAGDNSNKYTGTLAAMTAPITLSPNWASLEEHKYEFAVALDASADNLYQGDNSVVPFTWDAS
jgi:spore coat-associated protein N